MSATLFGVGLTGLLLVSSPATVDAVNPLPVERPIVASPPAFDPGHAAFNLTTGDGLDIGLSVFALFFAPGETLALHASEALSWIDVHGEQAATDDLRWTAPDEPSLTTVTLRSVAGDEMQLNLVVMRRVEADSGDSINGFAIGQYPQQPYRGEEAYRAPDSFIEFMPGLEDLAVSPHFRLGQFLCKQEGEGEARYLVLSERLILKLERILEASNARGWRTDSFTVMSGYRTPAYNAGLGNGENSRHIYGGAADIFIDTDGDGVMDDLNGDGVLDRQDAAALFELVEALAAAEDQDWQPGGLGEYAPNAHHGAFVHVDERGWRARWGR